MPELPDVEVTKRYLNATSLHKEIEDVRVHHTRILKGISRPTLRKRLRHRKLMATRRHGKHLFAEISGDGWLMLHFGMTGFLRYFKRKSKQPDHIRMQIDFDNGYHLAYDNQRLLGQVGLIRDPHDFLIPHRHAGGSCPQCGHSLKKIGISGRHAYVCTKCQSAAA